MIGTTKQIARIVTVVALLAGVGVAPAHAEDLSVNGIMGGTVFIGPMLTPPQPAVCDGSGAATPFGSFTMQSQHIYTSPDAFAGTMMITTRTGVLVASYTGVSDFSLMSTSGIVADQTVADIDPVNSTGAYRGA